LSPNIYGSSHCCHLHLFFSILQVNRKYVLPFILSPSSGRGGSLSISCDQRQEVSLRNLWPSHSTWRPLAGVRPLNVQVTDGPQTPVQPLASMWDHLPMLNMDLLFRSNLQIGSCQHGCIALTAEEPCRWLMPGETLSTDTLTMLFPQSCCLLWDWACLFCCFSCPQRYALAQSAGLPWPVQSDERISPVVFRARGRGKISGTVFRHFVPVQLSLRETLRPYLQSGRAVPWQQPRTRT